MNPIKRAVAKIGPALQDLGTVFLGIAAILFTRSFPTSQFSDFELGMMAVSLACVFVGVGLRALGRASD